MAWARTFSEVVTRPLVEVVKRQYGLTQAITGASTPTFEVYEATAPLFTAPVTMDDIDEARQRATAKLFGQ